MTEQGCFPQFSSFFLPLVLSKTFMAHPELQHIRQQLLQIHDHILNFKPLTARPPILDSSYEFTNEATEENQWLHQENIPGLKKLKESIRVDLGVLDKVVSCLSEANIWLTLDPVVSRRAKLCQPATVVNERAVSPRGLERSRLSASPDGFNIQNVPSGPGRKGTEEDRARSGGCQG